MCVHSDSEMEIEAEHYSNGVIEGCSAQVMNGSYNHEEMLQQDDISIGNGIKGTARTHTHTHIHTKLRFCVKILCLYVHLDFIYSAPLSQHIW